MQVGLALARRRQLPGRLTRAELGALAALAEAAKAPSVFLLPDNGRGQNPAADE